MNIPGMEVESILSDVGKVNGKFGACLSRGLPLFSESSSPLSERVPGEVHTAVARRSLKTNNPWQKKRNLLKKYPLSDAYISAT